MLLLVSLKLSKRKLLAKDCHCSSPIPNIVPPLYTWILNRIRNCQVIQSCVFDCRPAARLARMDCGKHFPMQGLANREEFSFPSSFENEEFLQGRTFFFGGYLHLLQVTFLPIDFYRNELSKANILEKFIFIMNRFLNGEWMFLSFSEMRNP